MPFFEHWSRVPDGYWRWPDFSPQEIACRGTGKLLVDEASMDKLQALRTKLGRPLIVNSGYRSHEHNKAVGGASRSQHLLGKAFDIRMDNHNPHAFEAAARAVGFRGIGHYVSQNFMHIDTRPNAAKWCGSDGRYFPPAVAQATPQFQPEQKAASFLGVASKPEVWGTATAAVTAGGTLAQGDGPVQFAIAIGLVALVGLFIWWAVHRARPKD